MEGENQRRLNQARLNRVLDYIHTHLDEALTLDGLAQVAGFSAFHFHRLFKVLTGETPGNYIQRARLERAAFLLRFKPHKTVLQIGLECGFSDPSAFSRAFKAYFGASPTGYRRQKRKMSTSEGKPGTEFITQVGYNEGRNTPFQITRRSYLPMNVEVRDLPAYHVAFIRHISGYRKGEYSPAIGNAFERVIKWAGAHGHMGPDTLVMGVPYDDPDVTPEDRGRYDACVTVNESTVKGSGEVGMQTLHGGKYAVITLEVLRTEADKIGQAADWLYGEWLPDSGFMADDFPPLEIYLKPENTPLEDWVRLQFCLPICPV